MPAYRYFAPKPWTAQDDAMLADPAAIDLYVPEVAKHLGRSQQPVQNRALRLKHHLKSAPASRYPADRSSAEHASNTRDAIAE